MSDRQIGSVAILAAAVGWGLLGPVARVAFADGLSALEVAFWRAVLGGALFVGHVLVVRRQSAPGVDAPPRLRLRDGAMLGVFGLVGVSLFYAAYQLAVERGGAALASVLLYTAPAWVAAMGATLLGERLTRTKVAAVALTLAGVVGIAASGARTVHFAWDAVAWGLVSGLSYALYYPFGKRVFDRIPPATVFAVALPVGALGLAPLVTFSAPSARAWMALAFVGVVSTYGAYLAYGVGVRRLEASRASIVATLEPVVAAAVAHVAWSERFGAWGYAGAVLILAAAFLTAGTSATERSSQAAQ